MIHIIKYFAIKFNKKELYNQLLKFNYHNKPYSKIINRKPKYLI